MGAAPPKMFLHLPCISKFVDLASKVFSIAMINCDCYVIIEEFLIVDYTISVLKYIFISSLQNMGVAAARPHPKCGGGSP